MKRGILYLLTILLFSGCAGPQFRYLKEDYAHLLKADTAPPYPQTTFFVFSDPHFYAPSLWEDSPVFRANLSANGKMFDFSEEILAAATEMIVSVEGDFVLIPGDLTKDGEKASHHVFSVILGAIEDGGKPVYVIPGNHDILNPNAIRFEGNRILRTESITPKEFIEFYDEFGYQEAIYRDPQSLSYVAEPVEGLWLLALDSCEYADITINEESPADGALRQETVDWIEDILLIAGKRGKAVIATVHHGILEHYPGQKKYDEQFLLDDFEEISTMLAYYNVRMVFTGHYHAQDISMASWPEDGKFIYDIETGSLVTYPSPIRSVKITSAGEAKIHSLFIETIDPFEDSGKDFQKYARDFIYKGAASMVYETMTDYYAKDKVSRIMSSQVADGFVAHIRGDEHFTGEVMFGTKDADFLGSLVESVRYDYVKGFWTDIPPADNDIIIDLKSGAWEPWKQPFTPKGVWDRWKPNDGD